MSTADELFSNGSATNGASEASSDWAAESTGDLNGRFKRFRDSARNMYGRAFGQTSERISDSVAQARESVDDVLDLVSRKPLVSVAVAALIGLTLGLLLNTGRTRLVFVERED